MKVKPRPGRYRVIGIVQTSDVDEQTRSGWGPCHSCNCRGFTPTGKKNDICNTCSHHWTRHW